MSKTIADLLQEQQEANRAVRQAERMMRTSSTANERNAAAAFGAWVARELDCDLGEDWYATATQTDCETYRVSLVAVHTLEPTLDMTHIDGSVGWRKRSQHAWLGWRVVWRQGRSNVYSTLREALLWAAGFNPDAEPVGCAMQATWTITN